MRTVSVKKFLNGFQWVCFLNKKTCERCYMKVVLFNACLLQLISLKKQDTSLKITANYCHFFYSSVYQYSGDKICCRQRVLSKSKPLQN